MALGRYLKNLGKLVDECNMCKDKSFGERWRYRNNQYIPDHIPKVLTVCRKCVYRECYGSKTYRKKMKENTLKDIGNA